MNYLYPAIYSKDIITKLNWAVPISDSNKIINNNLSNKLSYQIGKDNNNMYYTRMYYTYKGQAIWSKTNIYYLISSNTESSANSFVCSSLKIVGLYLFP